ncbi:MULTISPECIES: ABC transporter permease [Vibrio harveyi group]|uniref:Transport permease protein n=2 Tax=Vibrio antiquarius (strain Ex25) TaxID=150340 RepID=A0ABM9WUB5_VIBAE|nr:MULTISPECIES: ABC transporter permease [Vibrio harveyi group]ACY49947.1 capsular polysaccharide ABC transporter permease protein KpsM [Vibrio antiquarius]EDN56866.1 putative polysialic acid transport protein [Vibrio antiquarius]KOY31204.1 polysialic acid transporter [Vibrio parahaemolyticus]MCR9873199.1 ABC transporter permease [Vibrio parahaemolyticus]HCH4138116.1 ABC transporter permease [Vibrio parahaemolyticus]
MKDLRQALRVQGRVLYALILREALGKYGKSRIGYLWALFEPLTQVLILVAIFSALGRKSPVGGDLAIFFTTGIVPWLIYSNIANRLSGALGANQALLAYPHVTPFDVLMGRALLESITMLVVFALIIVSLQLIGKALAIYDLFNVLMGLITLVLFSVGLGMTNSAIRIYFDSWDKLFSAINRPLYFISGIFFTAASLPPQAREYLQWNPLFQYVEWVRSGFFSTYQNVYINHHYAISCSAGMLLIGLALTQYTKEQARNL